MGQCIECLNFDICQLSGAFADDEACEDFENASDEEITDLEEPGEK